MKSFGDVDIFIKWGEIMLKIKRFVCLPFFLILLLIILGLTGCEQRETNVNLSNNEKYDLDLDSFFNLQECIIENDLKIIKGNSDNKFSLNVQGKYDLNNDGKKDSIKIRLLGREESTARINKSEISIESDHPFDFYLVDLVKDDGFVELAIYDDGPSADPMTTFYRYDGKKIHELGSFYTDINVGDSSDLYYGNVLTDGKGNFIEPGSLEKLVSPNIIKGYSSLKNNQFIYNSFDYSKYLDKEYSITTDFEAFFIDQDLRNDLKSQDIEFVWDVEDMIQFKKGEKIKIIIHDEFWYGVELGDGTTGILYFWMGD